MQYTDSEARDTAAESSQHFEDGDANYEGSSAAITPYNDLPRVANNMASQSVSIPDPENKQQSCDICLDSSCDNAFPPCCDTVGSADCDGIPDLELCDHRVTWIQRLQFSTFFEFGKVSKLCTWYCISYDRVLGWSKVADATVDCFKFCGNPEIFNTGCVVSCVPYFALCYLIYIPLWLPCYACFALSQSFRKVKSDIKSRTCRFLVNASYLLSASIGLTFRGLANMFCKGRTCFGARKGCGPECAQLHRGGRYYTNYGLKGDGYEEYCLLCDQSWETHAGDDFFCDSFVSLSILGNEIRVAFRKRASYLPRRAARKLP